MRLYRCRRRGSSLFLFLVARTLRLALGLLLTLAIQSVLLLLRNPRLLSKGERAKMNIPSHMGFGKVGVPGLVPPNSNLIYDVELIDYTEH